MVLVMVMVMVVNRKRMWKRMVEKKEKSWGGGWV